MRQVAITGLGAVTPVGNTASETWESLVSGKSGIGKTTAFDTTDFKVKVSAEVKGFDPLQYFEKSELRKNDPFTLYAVAATEQAMQDSALGGNIDPERLGVYIGSGIGGTQTTITEATKLAGGNIRLSPFMVPMMIVNMASGVVSMRYNAQGPTLPVVTACATSTNAIGEAYRAIAHGYADAIIAGGSDACVTPFATSGFTSCMALTTNPDPATACVPFDARRNGFVMGEGAAVLILEEAEHARARGAHIYALVSGYGNTSDAHHITAPHPDALGITRAVVQAMKEAGAVAGVNTYINAHGTSTQLNDKSETLGFKNAFGAAAYEVAISSTKSMTGHMLGAAGAIEALACAKTLETGIAPPTIGYAEKDPECDLDYTPGKAAKRPFDTAVSTSLGFGGHNACIVLKKEG